MPTRNTRVQVLTTLTPTYPLSLISHSFTPFSRLAVYINLAPLPNLSTFFSSLHKYRKFFRSHFSDSTKLSLLPKDLSAFCFLPSAVCSPAFFPASPQLPSNVDLAHQSALIDLADEASSHVPFGNLPFTSFSFVFSKLDLSRRPHHFLPPTTMFSADLFGYLSLASLLFFLATSAPKGSLIRYGLIPFAFQVSTTQHTVPFRLPSSIFRDIRFQSSSSLSAFPFVIALLLLWIMLDGCLLRRLSGWPFCTSSSDVEICSWVYFSQRSVLKFVVIFHFISLPTVPGKVLSMSSAAPSDLRSFQCDLSSNQ